MKGLLIGAFVLMVLVQWFVPVQMIFSSRSILKEGKLHKFRTRPVDPTDAFRGKYVDLTFADVEVRTDSSQYFDNGEEVYITLKQDSAGYAVPDKISRDRPGKGEFMEVSVEYSHKSREEGLLVVQLQYPFNRLYMEEFKATDAENAYWQARSDSSKTTYAIVRVLDGNALLENVMVNDSTLADVSAAIHRRNLK